MAMTPRRREFAKLRVRRLTARIKEHQQILATGLINGHPLSDDGRKRGEYRVKLDIQARKRWLGELAE